MEKQTHLFPEDELLLKCYRCKGDAVISKSGFANESYIVKCSRCGHNSGYSYANRERAATLWNLNNRPEKV